MGNIFNITKTKVLKPTKSTYEFSFRIIKNNNVMELKKVTTKGFDEGEALIEAMKTAKTKFIDAVEINYTGIFRKIN